MGILPVSTSTTQIKGKCYEKIIMNKEKERKKLKSTRAWYTELKHILAVSTLDCNIIVQLWP